MLKFIDPMIPTLAEEAPAGDGWIHEVKYDGYRSQLIIEDGKTRIYTRNGYDWTAKYWPIAVASHRLPCKSAIIDGEMIVPDAQGVSDFSALPEAIARQRSRLVFVAFDLLHLDGVDFRSRPLIERRAELWKLVQPGEGQIQFSAHVEGGGGQFFAAVDQMGRLEGIVSKKASSRYRSGPTKNWLKVKCFEENDYEVAGVLREPGSAPMALMVTRSPERRYVGSAVIGLNREMKERLWRRVQEKSGPAPKGFKKPAVKWTTPGLVGRVRHLKGEETLRHATLKDLFDPPDDAGEH